MYRVVGGIGAILNGVPIITLDLDIVHSREPENVQRLLRAMEKLDAHYREQPERRLLPFTTIVDVGNNIEVRLLNLGKLIQMKEEAGRDKDKAALSTLRSALKEKLKKESKQ